MPNAVMTQLFQMLPWNGGLNTSMDESTISPNQLTVADNVVFGTRGSRKKRDGINHNWSHGTLTAASIASPTSVTSTAHGLTTGDTIVISGSNSTPTIDGTRTVTVTGANTFTIPVNVTVAATTGSWYISGSTAKVIGLHDFWFKAGAVATQKLVAVTSTGQIFSYNPVSGARTVVTGGTAWSGTLTTCSMVTFNNKLFIAVSGAANVAKFWDGTTLADLPNQDDAGGDVSGSTAPPKPSFFFTHQGRLFCNDKNTLDRLFYSPPNNHLQWSGYGDSGAIDIGIGDGDPEGITGGATFKGDLFCFKRTRTYRVSGYQPEEWMPSLISDAVGAVAHGAIAAVDQDDLYFISDKGVHSIAATANYGDFTSSFVSLDIQKTFNEDFDNSRLKFSQAVYIPTINSVAFSFTAESGTGLSLTSSLVNNSLWFYNIPLKAWFRWTDMPATSMCLSNDSDQRRLYLGTHTGRISKCFNGTNYDISAAGVSTGIRFKIVTGQLFMDNSPYTIKGFKRFILYYRPRGQHTITADLRIDNVPLDAENSLNFSSSSSSALLGTTFTLGSSTLGYDVVLGPYIRSIDGYGRGVKITLEQIGTDEQVDIQGFAIEFEGAGTSAESAQN